jgi:diguanylate cyclase
VTPAELTLRATPLTLAAAYALTLPLDLFWLSATTYQASVFAAALLMWRGSFLPRVDRVGAWSLALATLLWGIGSTLSLLFGLNSVGASLSHIGYLAFYPLALLGFSRLLVRRTRLQFGELLNALIVGLGSAAVLATAFVYLVERPATIDAGAFINHFYPVGDILLISYALGVGVLISRVLTPRALFLMTGMVAFALFDIIYLRQMLAGAYVPLELLDAGWLIGFLLLAEAPFRFMEERQPRISRGWSEVIVSIMALSILLADTFDLAKFRWYTQLPAALTLLLAFLRLFLALQQSRKLVDEQHLARTDELTGLPNRRRFVATLASSQDAWRATGEYGAVMLLDLNGFKEVNDTLGHQAGDDLLRLVSARLQDATPRNALLARLGGDEFGLILHGEADETYVLIVAAALQAALDSPIEIPGARLRVETSIGIALAPTHGTTTSDLLRHADVAMYRSKRTRSVAVIFDPAVDTIDGDRLGLAEELREALDRRELVLNYQPKIDLATNSCMELEALIRWQHPRLGLLGASEFLPLAERTGLIADITSYVVAEAVRQVAEWRLAGLDVSVAINVNAAQLEGIELVDYLLTLLDEASLSTEAIILEITEEVLVRDPAAARAVITHMDRHGIRVSIDDFGTGYSSLSYLQHLPAHELKLDRAFVADLGSNDVDAATRARAVAKSVIDLATSLGMASSAEGVERREQLEVLTSIDCDSAQGFLFAPPMSAVSASVWLASRSNQGSVFAS